jgi:hypothetical protein
LNKESPRPWHAIREEMAGVVGWSGPPLGPCLIASSRVPYGASRDGEITRYRSRTKSRDLSLHHPPGPIASGRPSLAALFSRNPHAPPRWTLSVHRRRQFTTTRTVGIDCCRMPWDVCDGSPRNIIYGRNQAGARRSAKLWQMLHGGGCNSPAF